MGSHPQPVLAPTRALLFLMRHKTSIALLLLTFPILGQDPPSRKARVDPELARTHFEAKVRPVLIEHCYPCHSEAAGKRRGGLLLDRRSGWQQGGDSGPALVPHAPEQSLLMEAVRYHNKDLQMPPDNKLPAQAIAQLEQWIRMGAFDPRTSAPEAAYEAGGSSSITELARGHFAFQPISDPKPPELNESLPAFVKDPLDHFLLASMQHAGLAPASPADRATWLRRASFVVTGLPPTLEELDHFLADPAPDDEAFATVVDRLLASPAFGERFARHWLDLVRYSDSNGLDENLAMANAWRYRDYVVRAFNEDLPYDRFVQEQIAGDLLPDDGVRDVERWLATGMLVMGPKLLAEQDKEKLAMDVVDEQLDVVGRAVLGLTIGCARCHDHKFDPIPTADYYALAGIFRSTSTLMDMGFVSKWREREVGTAQEFAAVRAHQEALAAADLAIRDRVAAVSRVTRDGWRRDLGRLLLAATTWKRGALFLEAEHMSRGNFGSDDSTYGSADTVVVHTSQPGRQYAEYDLTVPAAGRFRLWIRYAAQSARPMELSLNGKVIRPEVGALATTGWMPRDQRWFELGGVDLRAGLNTLAVARDGPIVHIDKFLLVRNNLTTAKDPELIRQMASVLARAAAAPEPVFWLWLQYAALPEDGFATRAKELTAQLRAVRDTLPAAPALRTLLDAAPPTSLAEFASRYQSVLLMLDAALGPARHRPATDDGVLLAVHAALRGSDGLFGLTDHEVEEKLPPDARTTLREQQAIKAALLAKAPKPLAQAMVVVEGKVADLPIHVRGSHLQRAQTPTPRGVLQITSEILPEPKMPASESGRRELARWITDPAHPLTARVAVNRLWQAVFGNGLVRSPANFGLRGDQPSHPELLDRLAQDFVADGWSSKRLLRRLLLSGAFRMASHPSSAALELDPDNRLLSYMPRRRLEAEAIRDGLLFVAGTLDRRLSGSLLTTENRDYVTTDMSSSRVAYDTPRRSLYLPVIRNAMYDLFTVFDFNDPSVPVETRPSTTIASQALLLMNSTLTSDQARAFARRARTLAKDNDSLFVQTTFRLAYARLPDPEELALSLHYLGEASNDPKELAEREADFCQALLVSSEFLTID